jgi:hypothetical protein
MPKIYFYKLTVDDGGAPCVEEDLLSLAICKPMIRRTAAKDDIVIGFAANSLNPDNRLIYVARVNDKLVNGDYFRPGEYSGRSDCIYEWRGGRFAARDGAIYHGSPDDLVHDLGKGTDDYPRANTLLSREFCYFGASGSDAYKKTFPIVAKAVAALGRCHRVHHHAGLLAELERLAQWNCALNGACIRGQPTGKPRLGVSHRGGGCGVAEC